MARWINKPNSSDVLNAAEIWKQECLIGRRSLFSDRPLWTFENINPLYKAIAEHPLVGSESFIDKLSLQLGQSGPDIQHLCAEVLWLLLLFVANTQMGAQAKRDRFARIWTLGGDPVPTTAMLSDAVLAGIAKPGTAFMTKMPDELEYALATFASLKLLPAQELAALLEKPWKFGEWLDDQLGSNKRAFRHMLLFLCFPDSYERIASGRHKRQLRDKLAGQISANDGAAKGGRFVDVDIDLLAIRRSLEQTYGTAELDFYITPLRELWLENSDAETPDGEDVAQNRQVWIEMTKVKGRADREGGAHALGQALWSPQRSKNGGDIYANMRRVNPGDVVFHLTDNEAITGVSQVLSAADDTFEGLVGTDWEGPAYRVQLHDFTPLDPPLSRRAFLQTEPFAAELSELKDSGAKGLFYNSNRGLHQGAYLTEATPTLLSILSRAYEAQCGLSLPFVEPAVQPAPAGPDKSAAYTIDDALQSLFLERPDIEEILLLWTAKKNIIIQGPPGVGKSFVAQKLAFVLMGQEDKGRFGFVQFHQSYSYEDFVEGFRPSDSGFELRAGKFVEFCRRAEADLKRPYVFVIDEINRGNLSKIMGELMLLIEADKRDTGWAMPLASGKVPFYVPPNVYVMGLMNTADRSLAVVDYALRRRFAFIDLKSNLPSAKCRQHLKMWGSRSRQSTLSLAA
jgi:hypothetical protein